MRLGLIPGIDQAALQKMWAQSIHTTEEFNDAISTPEGFDALVSGGATVPRINKITEFIAMTDLADIEDRRNMFPLIKPSNSLSWIRGFTEYATGELSDICRTVGEFKDATDTPEKRKAVAKKAGMTELMVNQLVVNMDIFDMTQDGLPEVYYDFTKELFLHLSDIHGLNDEIVHELERKDIVTIADLDDLRANKEKIADIESACKSKFNGKTLIQFWSEAWDIIKEKELGKLHFMECHTMDFLYATCNLMKTSNDTRQRLEMFVRTLDDVSRKTINRAEREKFAKLTGLEIQTVNTISYYADLMHVPLMTPWAAEQLIKNRIRNVKELAETKIISDGVIIDPSIGNLSMRVIIPYIIAAKTTETSYRSDEDEFVSYTAPGKVKNILGISDMLTELGRGIGKAQHELDMYSLQMQKEILRNRDMSEYGMTATWYTMPETELKLRMQYNISDIRKETGKVPERQVDIIPVNAEFASETSINSAEESLLTLKFVPVPPPDAFIQRREAPELKGMTKAEAEAKVASRGIKAIIYSTADPDVEDNDLEVTYQSLSPGRYLGIGEPFLVLIEPKVRRK